MWSGDKQELEYIKVCVVVGGVVVFFNLHLAACLNSVPAVAQTRPVEQSRGARYTLWASNNRYSCRSWVCAVQSIFIIVPVNSSSSQNI